MRELEKDGKLPESYYAKRRIKYTGGGVSIIFIIFLLWRFGIFGMIFSSLFFMNGEYQNPEYMINTNSSIEANELFIYCNESNSDVDNLIDYVYLDVYKYFYEKKDVSIETFTNYQSELPTAYKSIETSQEFLEELLDMYTKSLDAITDILEFSVAHYDKTLAKPDKLYLDTLLKKYRSLNEERTNLVEELWETYIN